MLKYSPYSYSKLSLHESCHRKFKYRYIDKIKIEGVLHPHLLKGGAVHAMIESYPNKSTHELAPKYKHIFDKFIETPTAQKYLIQAKGTVREMAIGLDEKFRPTNYKSKDAIFRGYVDYIGVIGDELHLADWKTGKLRDLKYQSFDQMMCYAIYFFRRYESINTIHISYVYVEHDGVENTLKLERQYLNKYVQRLYGMIEAVETDTKFEKNPSRLCDWCDYKEHCDKDI